jgi:hypothetical protein
MPIRRFVSCIIVATDGLTVRGSGSRLTGIRPLTIPE